MTTSHGQRAATWATHKSATGPRCHSTEGMARSPGRVCGHAPQGRLPPSRVVPKDAWPPRLLATVTCRHPSSGRRKGRALADRPPVRGPRPHRAGPLALGPGEARQVLGAACGLEVALLLLLPVAAVLQRSFVQRVLACEAKAQVDTWPETGRKTTKQPGFFLDRRGLLGWNGKPCKEGCQGPPTWPDDWAWTRASCASASAGCASACATRDCSMTGDDPAAASAKSFQRAESLPRDWETRGAVVPSSPAFGMQHSRDEAT
jgi:hypothetical protein